ncbi:MAG: hypothetical protein NDI73_04580 [Desulfuromonadales bacterium]|nr:hypothetical protein [Desulfuromonadales bacterium]
MNPETNIHRRILFPAGIPENKLFTDKGGNIMFCRKILLALTLVLLSSSFACADLDLYLQNLSVSAQADFGDFRAQVGAHFGASDRDLDLVFQGVYEPADAVLCFWLGQQSHRPYDVVMREYRTHKKGKGWGALAQSLGIKPGSPAFKRLKNGDLGWEPVRRSGHGKDKSDDQGKDQGKDKGKGGKDDKGGKDQGKGKSH